MCFAASISVSASFYFSSSLHPTPGIPLPPASLGAVILNLTETLRGPSPGRLGWRRILCLLFMSLVLNSWRPWLRPPPPNREQGLGEGACTRGKGWISKRM